MSTCCLIIVKIAIPTALHSCDEHAFRAFTITLNMKLFYALIFYASLLILQTPKESTWIKTPIEVDKVVKASYSILSSRGESMKNINVSLVQLAQEWYPICKHYVMHSQG